jgi:hypothetical protein
MYLRTMEINDTTLWLIIICAVLFLSLLYCGFIIQKLHHKMDLMQIRPKTDITTNQKQLQLAAYERVALFTERTKLDNLISKLYSNNFNAKEMQQILVHQIKEEYEHNIAQQLYINAEVWNAVTKMKEQNIYILNQVGQVMPQHATALDYNKGVLEVLQSNENATMNAIVLSAIQYETKLLLL